MKCPIAAGVLLALTAVLTGQAPAGDASNERVYSSFRTGRYADARRLIDALLKTGQGEHLRSLHGMLAGWPNMRVRHAPASFACEVRDGLVLPIAVNGKPVNWLADTGAGVTMVSALEAARLGLELRDWNHQALDLAGNAIAARAAVARRLVIGRTQFQDVPLLVTSPEREPFADWAPGRQGILGLPLVIGLGALRWTRAGMCHTGSRAAAGSATGPSNLRYEGQYVVANAEFDGKTLDFLLDTGNQAGTQLWGRFGDDFEALKARGRPGSVRSAQMGGAVNREVTVIPGVRLLLGGKDVALAEANLFARSVGDLRYHGLLGTDLLSQADEVMIDFRAMRLTLR